MIFKDARCPVPECPHNHGERGCSCGFAGYRDSCLHPTFKRRWAELTAIEQEQEFNPKPATEQVRKSGLTSRAVRAMKATTPLTPVQARERALQLAMELGYP